MSIIDVNTIFGAYPSEHADSTAETLLKEMAAHDVSKSFSLSTWGIFHREAMGNDHTLRAQQHFDGKIAAVATMSPHDFYSDATVDLLVEKPFLLFRFFPNLQEWPIEYAPFIQILSVLSAHKKPIMVTTSQPGQATILARLAADYDAPVILEGIGRQNYGRGSPVFSKTTKTFMLRHMISSCPARSKQCAIGLVSSASCSAPALRRFLSVPR